MGVCILRTLCNLYNFTRRLPRKYLITYFPTPPHPTHRKESRLPYQKNQKKGSEDRGLPSPAAISCKGQALRVLLKKSPPCGLYFFSKNLDSFSTPPFNWAFFFFFFSFEKFFFDGFPFKTRKVIINLQDLQSSQLLQFLH